MLRRERVAESKNIRVSVSDMKVLQRTDRHAQVIFRQDYRSDHYQDSVRKRLELVRDGERWLIAEEQVVATLAGPDAEPTNESATTLLDKENSVSQIQIAAAPLGLGGAGDMQQNAASDAPEVALTEEPASGQTGVRQMEAKAKGGEDSARSDVVVHQQGKVELARADTGVQHILPRSPSDLDGQASLHVVLSCKKGGIEFPQYRDRCLY
jgi:hypothetical protein